ncbi:MAG: VOC family protein [Candidatus Dormibacteraeota bacterium]|nr:VOC family protein [Candidatus Dormibacteraeota bacterium]
MNGIGTFHHVGVACRSLDREVAAYAALGYAREGAEFDDPGNGIRGVFLAGPGPRIELVVDCPGQHVVEPWLRRGSAMYHVAFEVDELGPAMDALRRATAKLVVRPRPAVAFAGRHISFLMLRNRMLVELIARS